MKVQLITLLAAASSVVAQAVTDKIAPAEPAPPGCKPNFDGKFEITIQEIGDTKKAESVLQARSIARPCPGEGVLVVNIDNGVMTDAMDRTGYVADNFQFQFDGPPQAGALYTAGFSACDNGTIALGGSTVFYQCKSGDFYNLYDRWIAEQCSPVQLYAMPCGGNSQETLAGSQSVVDTVIVSTTVLAPLADGQPQVITTIKSMRMCQIGDGQVQGRTTPCDEAPPMTATPVSQGPDGQIEVTPFPSATLPPDAAVPAPNGTTLRNNPAPPSVVPTNAPAGSNAGKLQLGSAAALVVGILGVAIAL